MAQLLSVQNVSKIFGSEGLRHKDVTVAVDDVTFTLSDEASTITAIAGESGSGKTTLALLMMGQLPPNSGKVMYRGKDLSKMTRDEKITLKREVQPIYQDPYAAYNPFYRVDHVLQMPIKRYSLAKTKEEARVIIEEAMEQVGLRPAETLGRFPHQLSGGQKQRVMVARALLCRPKVVMADEPVSMVDASLRAMILDIMLRLRDQQGISFLYITHDLSTAYQIGDQIYVLYQGAVAEKGETTTVIENPKHPYVQLLIDSIPVPDPKQKWVTDVALPSEEDMRAHLHSGCRFYPRCPHRMDRCLTNQPPQYVINGSTHEAACFLYDKEPAKTPDPT